MRNINWGRCAFLGILGFAAVAFMDIGTSIIKAEAAVPTPKVYTPEGLELVIEVPGYNPARVGPFQTEGDCSRALARVDEHAPAGTKMHCEVQA